VVDTLTKVISYALNSDYDVRFTVKESGNQVRRAASLYDHGLAVLFFDTMRLEGEGSLFDRALALVRDLQRQSNAALIVITTMRPRGFATQMERAGVDAMIDAPFDIPVMKNAIHAALECRRLRQAKQAPLQEGRQSGRAPRILLRDDQTDLLDIYTMMIWKRWPHATIVACPDARAAWEELESHPPDLLITDLNNAGMSGIELIERLAERQARFPILVCSASLPDCEAEVRAIAGPDLRVGFLRKPATVASLVEQVERLLG